MWSACPKAPCGRPSQQGTTDGCLMSLDGNEALSRRLYEKVFGRGNLDATDEIMAEDRLSIRVLADGAVASVPVVRSDLTLLRERSHPEVYVIYGGARIWISRASDLQALGFSLPDVSRPSPECARPVRL